MMWQDEYGEWHEGGDDTVDQYGATPTSGTPVVGGGLDPWGQGPDSPNYGYPPSTGGGGDPTAAPGPGPAPSSGTIGPFDGQFEAPDWMGVPGGAPQPDLPTFAGAPAFSFKAPSVDEAMNDPGYQFRVQQGTDALQRWAAARGTLNDSGTANALTDYGQNAATQEYANVWNRDWTSQKGQYDTNYQTQVVDPYKFQYQSALDKNAPRVQAWQAQVDDTRAHNQANYAAAWNKFALGADLWKFNAGNALGA